MKPLHFFIDRPVFAVALSLVVCVAGALAYRALPSALYPEVVPPTVVVRASYPGASAAVIAETVATPIEQEVNGVEDMLYLSSQSTADGSLVLTVTFKLGVNLDMAQVLVQNRVALAEPRLPEEVRRRGITVRKASPDLLLVVHFVSPDDSLDQLYISNYATLQVRDRLARVDGVGDLQLEGARDYSMRVWLDPNRLHHLGLAPGDVTAALERQNVQVASGVVGQPPTGGAAPAFQVNVTTLGRLSDPEQFADVVVKTGADGRVVRVKDVGRVELAALDYAVNSYWNGRPAAAFLVQQRPGSNALDTARRVRALLDELARDFPAGLEHHVTYDATRFVEESVRAVEHTLLEAAALVVVVVVLFLQSWRAAVIPLLAIPVSLLGTFAVMHAAGFSLNNLSLFGLVLAIGIVVDDAIVVVENVERYLAEGLPPREATRRTMDEVGGALVGIAAVLSAVFVPTAFLPGMAGQFYRQFALTIATATLFSAFVSLTLSPALAAVLLRPRDDGRPTGFRSRLVAATAGRFFRLFNRGFDRGAAAYAGLTRRLLGRRAAVFALYAGLLGLTWVLFGRVPAGFIPAQDQGFLITVTRLPEGASLPRTDAVGRRQTARVLDTPGVARSVTLAGYDAATGARSPDAVTVFAVLAPFEERSAAGHSADRVLADLRARLETEPGGAAVAFPPPPVRGIGSVGGVRLMVQDRRGRGHLALEEAGVVLADAGNRQPAVRGAVSGFRAQSPQYYADVDRVKALMMDVPVENVFGALQTYLGSSYVNDLNLYNRTFRVTAQADATFRDDAEDLRVLRTRSRAGASVPLSALAEIRTVSGPTRVERYNLYPATAVDADTAPGASSGQAMAALERAAAADLPDGFGHEWTGLAYEERSAGDAGRLVFPLCVLFVFLVLAMLYESWLLPLAIVLIVPMCLLSGILGVWLRGMDNNVLTQIGFVVLVGLACKNAILIVEFARAEEERGRDRAAAAVEACRLRLRPILMTSLAFILGVVPLVVAAGPGAEMRQALGTTVFAGMLGVTFFGLLFTPVFYVALRGLSRRRPPAACAPGPDAGGCVAPPAPAPTPGGGHAG